MSAAGNIWQLAPSRPRRRREPSQLVLGGPVDAEGRRVANRDLSLLGLIHITERQRRIAFNTLIISSIAFSSLLALAGGYTGLNLEVGSDPWMVAVPSILSAGVVLFTYGFGGWLLHGQNYGWAFFQPGRGGKRFVWLQAASWFCVTIQLIIPWTPWLLQEIRTNWKLTIPISRAEHNGVLLMVSSAIGLISQMLTVTSLFAYKRPKQPFAWRMIFTEGADARAFIYFFFSVQTGLACYAVFVLFVTEHLEDLILGSAATLAFVSLISVSTSLTHGVGGPWLRGEDGFTAFQPGRGGWRFVFMQFVGWTSFSLSLAIGIARSLCILPVTVHPIVCFFANNIIPSGATPLGILGLFAQVILTLSLFAFEEAELNRAQRYYRSRRHLEREAWKSCHTGLPPECKRLVYDFL